MQRRGCCVGGRIRKETGSALFRGERSGGCIVHPGQKRQDVLGLLAFLKAQLRDLFICSVVNFMSLAASTARFKVQFKSSKLVEGKKVLEQQ
ncbi:hypothetical protein E2320_006539 [Naja naja]|nr:hypothetical protein E2320_006539 [Naja naja]